MGPGVPSARLAEAGVRDPGVVLGTSPDSALLAAELGLPYSVALFINPNFDPRIVEAYRARFKPSALTPAPRVMIALHVFCAERAEDAAAMCRAGDLTYIRFVTRTPISGVCSPEEAALHVFGAEERAFIQGQMGGRAVGTPDAVHARLAAIASKYGADEIMVVCNTFHFEQRLRCFELLM